MSTTTSNYRSGDTTRGSWQLDPQRSSVEFCAGNFWGLAKVKGHFGEYRGQLDLSDDHAIELTIDAASLNTGNGKRDEHLRSADFFDAEHHPRVQFLSSSVEPVGDALEVRGSLSARGRTIPVIVDAHLREVDGELEIEAAATIAHRELGMTWSPLRIISPRTKLSVKARLVPATSGAA